jgi:hypothetical protein
MARSLEKTLDRALEAAFRSDQDFVQWFVQHTKFAAVGATYEWSRCNWVWGKIPHDKTDSATGRTDRVLVECETDVLVVLRTSAGQNVALHIENKLAGGTFEPLQPELYLSRAKHWVGKARYHNYVDWETVLVTPKSFLRRFEAAAAPFSCQVAHEELAKFVPAFHAAGTQIARERFKTR